jgi:hypothetical protein
MQSELHDETFLESIYSWILILIKLNYTDVL